MPDDSASISSLNSRNARRLRNGAYSQTDTAEVASQGPTSTHGNSEMNYNKFRRGDLGDVSRVRVEMYNEDSFDQVVEGESELKQLFLAFIEKFVAHADDPISSYINASSTNDSTYVCLLKKLLETQLSMNEESDQMLSKQASRNAMSFDVSLKHINSFSTALYQAIVSCAADSIIYMDEVIEAKVEEILGSEYFFEFSHIKVRLYDSLSVMCMRDLNPSDIEQLVSVKGIVLRCSDIMPDMQNAAFRCTYQMINNGIASRCGHMEYRVLIGGEIDEPTTCSKCGSNHSFELAHNSCEFGNKQLLKIQEAPDHIPEGETPQTLMVYVYDEIVDMARPGDRVEVTGIFKVSGVRVIPRTRNLKSVYRVYIDAIHIRNDTKTDVLNINGKKNEIESNASGVIPGITINSDKNDENDNSGFSDEMITMFEAMGSDPDIYEKITASLAPSIWENEDVKKGLICQLFGGSNKDVLNNGDSDAGIVSTRREINILLCGDPSTAKSQLLRYVHGIAPRGYYISGKGTSAVGLTAYITKDPETKELILESGALVLSDRGICCIDEFDKMNESVRTILHEAMEQQTVSVAKAGIICSLNARVAILASANPINSRYDTRRSVVDNLNLPPTLMSRFDLIYLVLDSSTDESDRRLAKHLCNLYTNNSDKIAKNKKLVPYDQLTMARYISYARKNCNPKLSPESCDDLIANYIAMRRQGGYTANSKTITATPRQLESLIRISEALAKIELSPIVKRKHVYEATRLMKVATYSAIVDPITGLIDMEQLTVGMTGHEREMNQKIMEAVLDIIGSKTDGMKQEQILQSLEDKFGKVGNAAKGLSIHQINKEFEKVIDILISNGSIRRMTGGIYRKALRPC